MNGKTVRGIKFYTNTTMKLQLKSGDFFHATKRFLNVKILLISLDALYPKAENKTISLFLVSFGF